MRTRAVIVGVIVGLVVLGPEVKRGGRFGGRQLRMNPTSPRKRPDTSPSWTLSGIANRIWGTVRGLARIPFSTPAPSRHEHVSPPPPPPPTSIGGGERKQNLKFKNRSLIQTATRLPTKPFDPLQEFRVYVRGLPGNVTAGEVRKSFEEYGSVSDTMIPRAHNQLSRGFAFVTMGSPEDFKAVSWKGGLC
ncbi:hypothetical protein AAMO2058_000730300 [Amorphochlora amoebiformis]